MSVKTEDSVFTPVVGICTHNPRIDTLRKVIASIANQTIVPAEVLIVDSRSSPDLNKDLILPLLEKGISSRIVRECLVGVSCARARAIRETDQEWLLFVDDDNELDADYIEQGIVFLKKHPEVGCVGGRLRLPIDIKPEEWCMPFLPYLGIRDYGEEAIIAISREWGLWEPATAGAWVNRRVLQAYAYQAQAVSSTTNLGRKGTFDLGSCEDSYMMRQAADLGLANAYCPDLRLTHHIAPHRLDFSYLLSLMTAYGRSHIDLRKLLDPDKIDILDCESWGELSQSLGAIIATHGSPIRYRLARMAHDIAAHHHHQEAITSLKSKSLTITLITPCLNAVETIERTLRSVEEQGYTNLEYVICDGGSTDGTLDVIKKYSHLFTRIYSEKDEGIANAINKGFASARGDIRCYLNADDCLLPNALNVVSSMFLAYPDTDVITGGCHRFYADGSEAVTTVADRFVRVISLRNDFEQPSTFWRTSIHEACGKFDESYRLAFDWEWWNRLNRNGARFKKTDRILSAYYFTDNNLTSRAGSRIIEEMYRVTKEYGPLAGDIADIYMYLYKKYDLNGFYDSNSEMPSQTNFVEFTNELARLKAKYGDELIDSYNWNWASKQVRGIKWY